MDKLTTSRRDLLRGFAGAAALYGLTTEALGAEAGSMPAASLLKSDADRYWAALREQQFLMPDNRAFLNTGSLGVAPRKVLDAVGNYLQKAAELEIDGLQVERYPRWGYETLDAEREAIAAFLGCSKDELALTHNATEAMSIIAGGLPLERGAEVLLTDQEHPSGVGPWKVREARGELTTRTVEIPLPPESPGQLVELITSAIGPDTRVLSFSGITSPTGLLMPIREICTEARRRGVITVVDGAHMAGQVDYPISEMGCDYFAGSPHKWLFAPAGSGVLYINEARLDTHFPVIATSRWDDKSLKAARFMRFGTNNRAIIEGFMAGLAFAQEIGPSAIYERIHTLARDVYERAAELPYVTLLSPADDSMYGSLVTFNIELPKNRLDRLWQLCDERKIWTTSNPRLRVSTHIHTRPEDIALFFDTLAEAAG